MGMSHYKDIYENIIMVKNFTKTLILISSFALLSPSIAAETAVPLLEKEAELVDPILRDPNKRMQVNTLVDTPYKLAAHYLPPMLLRALIESHFYRSKRKAHYERTIYLPSSEAGTKTLTSDALELEKLSLDLEAKGLGLLGRKITAKGKLNNLNLSFFSEMKFKISKHGTQDIKSTLGGLDFINIKVVTDGKAETNDVTGTLLDREVDYHTKYRDTEGKLAKFDYKLHVQGIHDKPLYEVSSNGHIGDYKIKGFGRAIEKDVYEFEENYGPLLIKSTLRVYD